jgi:hypothetical protein
VHDRDERRQHHPTITLTPKGTVIEEGRKCAHAVDKCLAARPVARARRLDAL